MKKLIITAACTAMAAMTGFAQGTVQFENAGTSAFYFTSTASTANKVLIGAISGTPAAASTSTGVVDVGLYWSATPFTDASQGTLGGTELIGTSAGVLAGSLSFALPPAPTTPTYIQVFAWDSTYSTPDAAIAAGAYFGAASAGQLNTTYGAIGSALLVDLGQPAPASGIPLFGTSGNVFNRTVLLSSPEPATIALGGLGAAALLLFRRRK